MVENNKTGQEMHPLVKNESFLPLKRKKKNNCFKVFNSILYHIALLNVSTTDEIVIPKTKPVW